MADTAPGTEVPPPAAADSARGAAATEPDRSRLSDEDRAAERRAAEQAEARDRWERRHGGWVLFAVIVLVLTGVVQIVDGVVALTRSETYLVDSSGLAVELDYTTWGWVHLALGAVAAGAGLGLLRGGVWARALGVGIAVLGAVAGAVFMPAFPALSLVAIALNVLVIYAIMVHVGVDTGASR